MNEQCYETIEINMINVLHHIPGENFSCAQCNWEQQLSSNRLVDRFCQYDLLGDGSNKFEKILLESNLTYPTSPTIFPTFLYPKEN